MIETGDFVGLFGNECSVGFASVYYTTSLPKSHVQHSQFAAVPFPTGVDYYYYY